MMMEFMENADGEKLSENADGEKLSEGIWIIWRGAGLGCAIELSCAMSRCVFVNIRIGSQCFHVWG
jgi:hypothetical protein